MLLSPVEKVKRKSVGVGFTFAKRNIPGKYLTKMAKSGEKWRKVAKSSEK